MKIIYYNAELYVEIKKKKCFIVIWNMGRYFKERLSASVNKGNRQLKHGPNIYNKLTTWGDILES